MGNVLLHICFWYVENYVLWMLVPIVRKIHRQISEPTSPEKYEFCKMRIVDCGALVVRDNNSTRSALDYACYAKRAKPREGRRGRGCWHTGLVQQGWGRKNFPEGVAHSSCTVGCIVGELVFVSSLHVVRNKLLSFHVFRLTFLQSWIS